MKLKAIAKSLRASSGDVEDELHEEYQKAHQKIQDAFNILTGAEEIASEHEAIGKSERADLKQLKTEVYKILLDRKWDDLKRIWDRS